MASDLRLLPFRDLVRTGPVDLADWNYRPVLGRIIRLRYRLALSLLPIRVGSLLEIGYGSGVFLPELARRCSRLYGLDVHERTAEVRKVLDRFGVTAELASSSVAHMPYGDGSFDCVVAVSTLEFVDDIHAASAEIARILRPAGSLVIVTPNQSPVIDIGLKLLTGRSAAEDFGNRRARLLPALERHFSARRVRTAPARAPAWLRFYTAAEMVPKPAP